MISCDQCIYLNGKYCEKKNKHITETAYTYCGLAQIEKRKGGDRRKNK